jgi:hypothetical protein
MFLSSFRHSVQFLLERRRPGGRASKGPRKMRLSVEVLEGRALPSTLTLMSAPETTHAAALVTMIHATRMKHRSSGGGPGTGSSTVP